MGLKIEPGKESVKVRGQSERGCRTDGKRGRKGLEGTGDWMKLWWIK